MRGDFSRIRLSQGKGYTSVLEQQGRVALDADVNEQRFLDEAARRAQAVDVIGEFGGPAGDEGFAISVSGTTLLIGPGRYYVDGLLCENPSQVSYDSQQFLATRPGAGAASLLGWLPSRAGVLQVYLQAWQRLVTALDDPCLREPALGQADTTARVQTVWRAIARPVTMEVPEQPTAFCPALYQSRPSASKGTLTVSTSDAAAAGGCSPVAATGYQGVENQLYRVEIHQGGDAGVATFKWSRENASVVSAITGYSGTSVQVDSVGPDANLGLQAGQWVELTDDTDQFGNPPNAPGALYQVQSVDKDHPSLTLAAPASGIDPGRSARVRRWDQSGPSAGPAGVPVSAGTPVELENGIQVTFGTGTYQPGDYWTFPARTATGTVEWPPCGSDGHLAQPPTSVQVREAPLAVLYWAAGIEVVPFEEVARRDPDPGLGPDPIGALPDAPIPFRPVTPVLPSPDPVIVLPPEPIAVPDEPIVLLPSPDPVPLPVLGHIAVEDCRRAFRPLTDLAPPPSARAIHVKAISWANDDVMPLDVLAANGLTVTLDQPVTSQVNGANFVVTIEPVSPQTASPKFNPVIRPVDVLDSEITVAGPTLTWPAPQSPAADAIRALLSPSTEVPAPRFARVRVRLLGQALFATGAAGLIYLDGRALGQPGTRADGTTARVDLRFPSGDGSVASDLESWFYLAPPLTLALSLPGGGDYTAVVDDGGHFSGIVPTAQAGTASPSPELLVEATFGYPAPDSTLLSVTLTSDPPAGPIAVGPYSSLIEAGQRTATLPIGFRAAPPAGVAAVRFTVTATVASPVDYWRSQQGASINFTLRAAGPILTFLPGGDITIPTFPNTEPPTDPGT